MEFGTGVLKVTPAHDQNDYEMWQRHKDEMPKPASVIEKDGRLNQLAGKYKGMKINEAREKVVNDLKEKGLLKKVENYVHNVALCYKCKNVIEPMLMKQWFVDIKPLAEGAIEVVKNNKVKIMPANQKKIYMHWMKNIKDWNISRQNWWGIEIPAWKCMGCSTEKTEFWTITDGTKPEMCMHCGGKKLERDPDIFDTWFSSGQWPFATLGYPNEKDFKTFYPTRVMETGYDILFFWVARMIMLGLWRTGKVPFELVYLHGLVRDKDHKKMSKGKGNVIDPLSVIKEYGADALRMSLIVGNSIGKDPVISEDKIRGYRNFSTKLWNITRFLLMNLEDYKPANKTIYSVNDKKILAEFKHTVKKVTKFMDKYEYWNAADEIYQYAWATFADKIVEDSKKILDGENTKLRKSRQKLLVEIWSQTLTMLHPFMPFVTEELYGYLPVRATRASEPTGDKNLLMIKKWPS